MAKRILAVGGFPGVGKTTLMQRVIKTYEPLKNFKYKMVRGQYCDSRKLYFIGKYDGSLFSGTDRLSMAVSTSFSEMVDKLPEGLFVFEGNRLFNQSLFNKYECDIYVVTAEQEVIEKRRSQRGSNQNQTFLKAVETKIKNIQDLNNCKHLKNNNQKEFEKSFDTLCGIIDEWNKQT